MRTKELSVLKIFPKSAKNPLFLIHSFNHLFAHSLIFSLVLIHSLAYFSLFPSFPLIRIYIHSYFPRFLNYSLSHSVPPSPRSPHHFSLKRPTRTRQKQQSSSVRAPIRIHRSDPSAKFAGATGPAITVATVRRRIPGANAIYLSPPLPTDPSPPRLTRAS